jgi:hypothetical protein
MSLAVSVAPSEGLVRKNIVTENTSSEGADEVRLPASFTRMTLYGHLTREISGLICLVCVAK